MTDVRGYRARVDALMTPAYGIDWAEACGDSEPLATNDQALGFDSFTNPSQASSFARMLTNGEPASGPRPGAGFFGSIVRAGMR